MPQGMPRGMPWRILKRMPWGTPQGMPRGTPWGTS